ncbi:MAG: hypothetical protein ABL935_07305, partial [Nitrospiraceae bacterium]
QLAIVEPTPAPAVVASQDQASLPHIPVAVLAAATLGLVAIFFAGLTMAATIRERRAIAEMNRNNGRWVYRIAA